VGVHNHVKNIDALCNLERCQNRALKIGSREIFLERLAVDLDFARWFVGFT